MKRQFFQVAVFSALVAAFVADPASAAAWRPFGIAAQKSQSLPDKVFEQLEAGQSHQLIVLLDESDVQQESEKVRQVSGSPVDTPPILKLKQGRFRVQKEQLITAVQKQGVQPVREYSHLPLGLYRIRDRKALQALLERDEVVAVYEDRVIRSSLAQSLPLINQSVLQPVGLTGNGSTVVVIDTGVNYTLPAFGSCTAPGLPAATCKVVVSEDLATADGALDAHGHGTNVAGIVVGTAPESRIAALDVFNSDNTSSDSLVLSGINWAIANKTAYNITALNMSLGDSSNNTTSCSSRLSNPYVSAVDNAKSAGIVSVAASGNSAYIGGIARPACTPGVVSVGAVYDSNIGSVGWTACSDATTAADKVACFSNSANFLTLLAPGALINAGGYVYGGTSQAAPHVAGAVAILRSAFPYESLDQAISRLVTSGTPVVDSRNGIVTPRLNLATAIGTPANDLFNASVIINGTDGSLTVHNLNAGKEAGEPVHGGNAGGASVWWHWTAPVDGRATIHTHGSGLDTLLAAYTGSAVTGLSAIADNDDDGTAGGSSSISFVAQAGTTYRIAVDGKNGAYGLISLSWSLVEQADLNLGISGSSDPVEPDRDLIWQVQIDNNGPSQAVAARLDAVLPEALTVVSASAGCSISSGGMSCDLGDLAAGVSLLREITVRSRSEGEFGLSLAVSSQTADPVNSNNSSTVTVSCRSGQVSDVPALGTAGMSLVLLVLMIIGFRPVRKAA